MVGLAGAVKRQVVIMISMTSMTSMTAVFSTFFFFGGYLYSKISTQHIFLWIQHWTPPGSRYLLIPELLRFASAADLLAKLNAMEGYKAAMF